MAESMTSKLTRVGVHGDPCENIHHRRGSAPRVARISHGIDDVAHALGHLAAVRVHDVPEAEHVAVRGRPPHQGVDGQQRVEPAPGLVDGLADEVGRDRRTARPIPRPPGTPTGPRASSPSRTRRRSPVPPGASTRPPPGISPASSPAAHSAQAKVTASMSGRWGSTSETSRPASSESSANEPTHRRWPVGAAPDGQRGAPVPIAGEGPVHVVGQPLPHPPVPDVLGVPSDGLVLGHQVGLAGGRPDVPAGLPPVDEGRVAPPTVRVGMGVGWRRSRRPAASRRSLTAVLVSRTRWPASQGTAAVNRPSGPTGLRVGRSFSRPTCRSTSPKAGARWTTPVPSSASTKSPATTRQPSPPEAGGGTTIVEGPLVVEPDQIAPGHQPVEHGALPEHLGHQVGGHDGVAHHRVVEVGPDRSTGVGQQGPRRGRPHHQGQPGQRAPSEGGPQPVGGIPLVEQREAARRRTRRPPRGRRRAGPARGC